MDVREGNYSGKTLFSQGEILMKNIIEDSPSYLLLMLVFRINSFSIIKENLGRSVREIDLFIKTRKDSSVRRKQEKKKIVKFAILLDVYSFVYFSLVIVSFRISASLIGCFRE